MSPPAPARVRLSRSAIPVCPTVRLPALQVKVFDTVKVLAAALFPNCRAPALDSVRL